MKPALLVIDMQRVFFNTKPAAVTSLSDAVAYINAAIELFRKKGLPIIVIEDRKDSVGRLPGTPGFETTEKIHLTQDDPRIIKTYSNAFNKTNLEKLLRDDGVDTLILTGFAATRCVLSTYRGALDLDFKPILLRGGLADYSRKQITFVQELEDIISYSALETFLDLL